jgi:hypothetical protein
MAAQLEDVHGLRRDLRSPLRQRRPSPVLAEGLARHGRDPQPGAARLSTSSTRSLRRVGPRDDLLRDLFDAFGLDICYDVRKRLATCAVMVDEGSPPAHRGGRQSRRPDTEAPAPAGRPPVRGCVLRAMTIYVRTSMEEKRRGSGGSTAT